jgi:hypothetical protein
MRTDARPATGAARVTARKVQPLKRADRWRGGQESFATTVVAITA